MDFGAIIKRAWQIMWHYKALWVLGVFAGVSGCQGSYGGGGGGGGGGNAGGWGDFGGMAGRDFSAGEVTRILNDLWPAIAAFVLLMIALGLVWSVFSIAARGGLIVGVSEIEDGRPRRLGELWRIGFSRFWRLVGLGLLVNLPLILLGLVFAVAIMIPFMGALMAGTDPFEGSGGALFAPLCGSLVLGIPVLIVASVVLGVMYLLGQRYIMLGDQGPIEAAGNAWRFLRARTKDTLLMYLLSGALNIAAGLVLAVPVIAAGVGLGIPLALGVAGRDWGVVATLGALLVAAVIAISLAYTAVWGTFTSALWTLFFRDLAGMNALAAVGPSPDAYGASYPVAPTAPAGYPPEPPMPPAPPVADA